MYAVIDLADFSLQAALRGLPDLRAEAVALVDPERTTPRVCALTSMARERGLNEGMTPTHALARCEGLRIRHRSLTAESTAMEALLQCAFAFSPNIELTAPGRLTLDLRGIAALTDANPTSLTEWAKRLRSVVALLDLEASVGVAATPDCARHAAGSTKTVCVVANSRSFITDLPIAALEPSNYAAEILVQWGIRTVGELLALNPSEVTERLGLEALGLFAAASTTAVRPLRLARPAERFEDAIDFEEPVETLEPLLFLLQRFSNSLGLRLEATGQVARAMTLRLRLESGFVHERELRVPEPTRQPEILFRMLRAHLETVRTETAVCALSLSLDPGQPAQRQFSLFETVLRDPHQFQETLGRLSVLLGADRIGSPVRMPGHQRDSFRLVPPDFETAAPRSGSRPELIRPIPWRCLRPETEATVQSSTANGAPLSVSSKGVNGRIRITTGPWRASGRWWESEAWSREDWEAQTVSGVVVRLTLTSVGWRITGLLD